MDISEPHQRLKIARERAGYPNAAEAARALGVEEPTYFAHENGSRGISRAAPRYAEFFRVSLDWLLSGRGEPPKGSPRPPPSEVLLVPGGDKLDLGPQDVPILGTVIGGDDGEFYFNGETEGFARRLPGIARQSNVFAMHVGSTSMVPRYKPGELVFASPRHASIGDDIIIELAPAEGERNGQSFIKTLARRSGTRIICEQLNPQGQVEYDTRTVKAVYRIIPLAELAGF